MLFEDIIRLGMCISTDFIKLASVSISASTKYNNTNKSIPLLNLAVFSCIGSRMLVTRLFCLILRVFGPRNLFISIKLSRIDPGAGDNLPSQYKADISPHPWTETGDSTQTPWICKRMPWS